MTHFITHICFGYKSNVKAAHSIALTKAITYAVHRIASNEKTSYNFLHLHRMFKFNEILIYS